MPWRRQHPPRSEGAMHREQLMLHSRVAELERMLASLGEGVVAVDSAGIVVHTNAAARELLAIEQARVDGHHVFSVVTSSEVRDVFDVVMREAAPSATGVFTVGTADAGSRVLQIRVAPLQDNADSGAGAIAVITDVSDQRRVEQMRRDFFSNVSHELKTPMAAIRGIIETIRDDPDMNALDRMAFLDRAVRQADRMDTLLADLIAISRLESASVVARRSPVDLADVIYDVVTGLTHRAERSDIKLAVEIGDSVEIMADEEALHQAVTNLVVNAITYTNSGGSVQVEMFRAGGSVLVNVSDSGIGIPAESLERIFERFYRVDPARSRERGGSGLGLSIVKHVARSHGGDITLISEPGSGSTFTLRLPISAAAKESVSQITST